MRGFNKTKIDAVENGIIAGLKIKMESESLLIFFKIMFECILNYI